MVPAKFRPVIHAWIALILLTGRASAQCEFGRLVGPQQGVPGILGSVHAAVTWDPDGPGPGPPILVAGGFFSLAGDTTVNNIAAWYDDRWHALGNINNRVTSLIVFNGELIAGGNSANNQPAVGIVRWNGVSWENLGGGVGGALPWVRALAVHNNDLYVGGTFTSAGGQLASGVARWDGAAWHALGGGVGEPAYVNALAAYGDQIVAAGSFSTAGGQPANRIASWDGTTWHTFGQGIGTNYEYVEALAAYQGNLVAGGKFSVADGQPVHNIAQWNGSSWEALGEGTDDWVFALSAYAGDLFVAGSFTTAGGITSPNLARWDGTSWNAVGSGVGGNVLGLSVQEGALVATGDFWSADMMPASSVAQWSGTQWQNFGDGITGSIQSFAEFQGQLVAVGVYGVDDVPAPGVAYWDGASWQPFAAGPGFIAQKLQTVGADLFAVGFTWTIINGEFVFTGHAARWNGMAWEHIVDDVDGYLGAAAEFNGELVVGGDFASIGGQPATRIARWNGTNWLPLEGASNIYFAGPVLDLAAFNGELIAAGYIASPGASSLGVVARWDGSDWKPMSAGIAEGPDGPVSSVQVLKAHGDSLLAGGNIVTPDGYSSLPSLLRWDGAAWQALPSPAYGDFVDVSALASYYGELVAAGQLVPPGQYEWQNVVARWDGVAWQMVAEQLQGRVYEMTAFHGELLAGGSIQTSDGDPVSFDWGRWGIPCPRGDLNADGIISTADVPLFIATVLAPEQQPFTLRTLADLTRDGRVDGDDIQPFVNALLGP